MSPNITEFQDVDKVIEDLVTDDNFVDLKNGTETFELFEEIKHLEEYGNCLIKLNGMNEIQGKDVRF